MSSSGTYRSKRFSSPAHVAVSAVDANALATALQENLATTNQKDVNGYTPMHLACMKKSLPCLQTLFRLGGQVMERDAQDNAGWTPLHCAALNGSIECLSLLVQNGATLDILNNAGMTPLHYASLWNRFECVKVLVEAGCDVNVRCTYTGKTPLHLAAEKSATESLNLLLEHGASVIDTDFVGRSTIDLANSVECVGILEGYRSRVPWHAHVFRCCIGGKVAYSPLPN